MQAMNTLVPLCVDLDGTLLNSDLLLETVFTSSSVSHWPRCTGRAGWLAGKARFKTELAALVDLEIETLPTTRLFLAFLHEQQRQGRALVLVTATHRALAERVAAHLGLFDRVLATDGDRNLAGARKAETWWRSTVNVVSIMPVTPPWTWRCGGMPAAPLWSTPAPR